MLPVVAVVFVLLGSASGSIPECDNVAVGSMHVLMDISSSIAVPADTLRTFAENLMEEFGSGKGRVLRVFSTFSDSVNVLFRDNDPDADPQGALNGLMKNGRYTDTAAALDYIKDNFITESTGCCVIVIVTDGESRDHVATAAAAFDLRDNFNVSFCVVPVGRSSCQGFSELNDLAGDSSNLLERLVDPDVAAAAAASCICNKCPAEDQPTTTTGSEEDCTLFVGEEDFGYGGFIVDSTGAARLLNESLTYVTKPSFVYLAACDGRNMFYTDKGIRPGASTSDFSEEGVRHFDGTNDKELVPSVEAGSQQSIAVDTQEMRVFFFTREIGIYSVDYQGLNQQIVTNDSDFGSYGMAVDEGMKFVYYTTQVLTGGVVSDEGFLKRVSYASSPSSPEILASGLFRPVGVYFDTDSDVLYLMVQDATIYTFDTKTPVPTLELLITENSYGPLAWSLVVCGGNIYYSDWGDYLIWRIPLTATSGDDAVRYTTDDLLYSTYALCIYH